MGHNNHISQRPSPPSWRILEALLLLFAASTRNGLMHSITPVAAGAATEQAHPHHGKVSPFEPGDPNVPLDNDAIETLDAGKPFQTQIQSGSSGRGLVVQDIHAPTDVVWGRILDFDHYSDMVPKTVESENYLVITNDGTTTRSDQNVVEEGVKQNEPRRQTIYTRMKVGFPLLKLQFFVKHEFYPELNSLIWTLDYSKRSDFDDSCGYWYVVPHPTKDPKEWTRLYYSVEVSMFDWVPGFVMNFMSNKALTEATGWVKKFSEQKFATMPKGGPKVISDTSSNPQSPKKKRRRWFGRKPSKEGNSDQMDKDDDISTDTCDTSVEGYNDETGQSSSSVIDNADDLASTIQPPKIGLTRYFLVGSVFAMSLYNVHLHFSGYRK